MREFRTRVVKIEHCYRQTERKSRNYEELLELVEDNPEKKPRLTGTAAPNLSFALVLVVQMWVSRGLHDVFFLRSEVQ